MLADLLPMVRSTAATVIDSAVVAALVYGVIDDLPMLSAAAPADTRIAPPGTSPGPVPLPARYLGSFAPDVDVARLEGEERLRIGVPPVAYRDIVGLRFQGINHGSSGLKSELLIIDGTIEALVELRAGQSADPRRYARIDRARRDVAVGIVLDLSSSTAERIDASATTPPRTNRDGSARRIIDTEREAVALLLRSLARLGDSAGVYGFSGSGRHDVRVRTVKDFREPLSIRTFERLAGTAKG